MDTKNIDRIKSLSQAAETLKNLRPHYLKKIEDSNCDKYNMQFGGDDRFSVFSTKVFLSCYLGYYGNSSCYTCGSVDNTLAKTLLNKALNKHMELILSTMAEFAEIEAAKLTTLAEQEIAQLQALVDSAKENLNTLFLLTNEEQ